MKKRRSRVRNSTRSSEKIQKSPHETIIFSRRKSFKNPRRQYITENFQRKKKCGSQEKKVLPLIKHPFDSLKSLFDFRKVIHVPHIIAYIHDETSPESCSTKSSEHFMINSFHSHDPEFNIRLENFKSSEFNFNRNVIHFDNLLLELLQEYDNHTKIMGSAERENFPTPIILREDEVEREQQRSFSVSLTSPENEDNSKEQENFSASTISREDVVGREEQESFSALEISSKVEDNHEQGKNFPILIIPGDVMASSRDENVRGNQNKNIDEHEDEQIQEKEFDSSLEELTELSEEAPNDGVSEISNHFYSSMTHPTNHANFFASTVTDSDIFKEMAEASNRCATIEKQIAQMQHELKELQQIEDFDGHEMLEVKRIDLMEKMSELDVMTRKIQETLGLIDPSSKVFTEAFESFIRSQAINAIYAKLGNNNEKTRKIVAEWQAWEDQIPEKDRFDSPQQEYSEDRLPKVIVCGHIKDEFPKIVIADSKRQPKGNEIQCLETITIKLAAALDIQEKLVKENALLESGKHKLVEALIDKDDVADTLQQEICGLRAEMHMIIKENSKLSHQLAALNQRLDNQHSESSRSLQHLTLPTFRHVDGTHRCQHCMQKHQHNTVCVSPCDNIQQSHNTPRLGGGGSTDNIFCNCSLSANENFGMCCENSGIIPVSGVNISSSYGAPRSAEIENKLTNYETSAKQLEQQLGNMDSGIRNIKMELANVQRERHQLAQQKTLLACTGPCTPCPCTSPTIDQSLQPTVELYKTPMSVIHYPQGPIKQYHIAPGSIPSCTGSCINAPMGGSNCPHHQLRDLREQYARLQEDYKNKLTEVSCLRTDVEKMKHDIRDAKDAKEKAENRVIDSEERLKIFESDRDRISGNKEQLMEQEQNLIVAKQRYTEAQDELEELRLLIQDQANQLEDYRNKYLQAQEQVEEQRHQIELMEMDNTRINENITLEIGRVKNQFQEKLSELAPLPDILKQTQIKFQESQQMRLIAERTCEELTRDLLNCKDKIGAMTSQSEILRIENASLKDSGLDNLEESNRELKNENERIKNALMRSEEREVECQKRIDDKKHEIAQLSSILEQVRQDSARQVVRIKERSETIRRRMQGEISEMEKQLVQCRTTAKVAQKDRDEIRQKMQGQINHLREAFNHAQSRIKNLQGHVNYLKPTNSNTYFTGTLEEGPIAMTPETHLSQYDTCDCNY